MRPIDKTRLTWLALGALLLATRSDHFGSSVRLPDASYAVFFLAGLLPLGGVATLGLALAAVTIDVVCLAGGADALCFTPAYPFMFAGYAVLWALGRAARGRSAVRVVALAALGASLAFLIGNAAYYLLSGKFETLSLPEYAARVAQYLPTYVGVTLLYVAPSVVLSALRGARSSETADAGAD